MVSSTELTSVLSGPVEEVAPRLLGAILRHGGVALRISEVEAYAGESDPGSHAYRGPTPRNSVMFGPAGHLYVYFTYGMHHCCNVVCGPTGQARACLIRAGEVIEGLNIARERRPGVRDRDLARGPANLCRVMGIDSSHNGVDLSTGTVTLTPRDAAAAPGSAGSPETVSPEMLSIGPRVGLRLAARTPWRFWLTGDPTVSRYRPAVPIARGPRGDTRAGAGGGA